jgi:hypothetical protein
MSNRDWFFMGSAMKRHEKTAIPDTLPIPENQTF